MSIFDEINSSFSSVYVMVERKIKEAVNNFDFDKVKKKEDLLPLLKKNCSNFCR